MFRAEYEIPLAGAASLRVREWGDPRGYLVIAHHGTPSSSVAVPGGWKSASESPLRIVSFDRPGYGGSPRIPGRAIADAADWSAAIADHLGRERFAVVGTSGGGPHAAATAARLPDRVSALGLNVSLGPYETPELDLPELPTDTAAEARAARLGEQSLRAFIAGLGSTEESLEGWMEILPPSDREVLARHDVAHEEGREQLEWAAQGVDGWVDDDLALFSRPWEFDPNSITVPTLVMYGTADVLVPPSHAFRWVERVSGAKLIAVDDGGHWLRDREPWLLSALSQQV